jgi:hypothetical protein
MAGTTPFTIGADVSCTDGACGRLSRLVIDPRAGTVSHLVVDDRQFQGRLVPLDLAGIDATTGQIWVRCTIAEFEKPGPASMTVRQDDDADPEHTDDQPPLRSVASQLLVDPPTVTFDTLPSGEVAVRGGEHVHALTKEMHRDCVALDGSL